MNISEAELLDALRDAATQVDARPEGALTITEMADTIGFGRDAIRRRIRPFLLSGRMECVSVIALDMTGRPQRTPAYRLIAPVITPRTAPKKKGKR